MPRTLRPFRPLDRQRSLKAMSLVVVAACLGCGADPPSTTDSATLLRDLERSRIEALVHADVSRLDELHAADFELINPYGERSDKTEYLGQVETGRLDYTVWVAGDMAVRVYGTAAVLRYDDQAFEARFDGEIVSQGLVSHTNLYEKRDGSWQIVWSHASGGM